LGQNEFLRGGSRLDNGAGLRSAKRGSYNPGGRLSNIGFRLAYKQIPNQPPTDLNTTSPLIVAENLPIGSAIGEFNATDQDANSTLTYHFVSGDNNNTFFTLEQNGTLKTATVFDFESNASTYLIQISVKDEYNATLEGNFTISLTNQNEPPIIESIHGANMLGSLQKTISIVENTNFAFDINASDPDGDNLIYEKTGGVDQNIFTLNIITGIFSFASQPDYESPQDADQNNTYEVWFRAKDGNNLYDEKRLTIEVTDVFENAPPSFQSDGNLTVSENTTFVYEFNATDPDGDVLTYSILHGPDASLFDLNQSSGALTFISPKDYEAPEDNNTDNVYQLTIQVADSGAPVSLNLNIEVTDVFENAPPSFQSDGNLTVSENTTFVYEFNATDPDGDVLTYSIIGGNDQTLFDLNHSSGQLTFLSPPDFEIPEDNNSDNNYEVLIQVSDGEANATLQTLVHVTDQEEVIPNNPPYFQSDGNLSVQENQTFVFEFNASDPEFDVSFLLDHWRE